MQGSGAEVSLLALLAAFALAAPSLAAPALAAPALASLVVKAEVSASDAAPVQIVRAVGLDAPAQSTVFYDPVGLRWEVVADADTLEERAVALFTVRVTDERGRVVGTFAPMLIGGFDEPMRFSVTHPVEPGLFFDLSAVVSREGDDDVPLARTFFADRGAQTYRFARVGVEGEVTCDDPALVATAEGGIARFTLTGRFQPGDRLDTRCAVAAPSGERSLPISLAFL